MINLMVADEHTIMRQALCELLETKGEYNVVAQANNGEELLKLLQNKDHPDLIIMDITMPKMNGIETIKALNKSDEQSQKPPVLVISANDQKKYVTAALNAGAKGFLPKSVQFNELLFAISSVMEGKTYLSPTLIAPLMTNSENNEINTEVNPFNVLSKRELEITKHLASGFSNREIAGKLHISIRTVDTHRSNILHKLKIRNNSDLTRLALIHNLLAD